MPLFGTRLKRMKTQCPHCKAIMSVPDSYAVSEVKCEKCKQKFDPYEHKLPQKDNSVIKIKKKTAAFLGILLSIVFLVGLRIIIYDSNKAGRKIATPKHQNEELSAEIYKLKEEKRAKGKQPKNTRHQNQLKRSTNKQEKQKETLEVKEEKPTQKSIHEAILRRELEGFFMDIPEVTWCKFDGNTVYVGFKTYPPDGQAILRGAALHGNAAINFGCHVWAVHADQRNNPPYYGTLSGKWYDEVTARYGRFK